LRYHDEVLFGGKLAKLDPERITKTAGWCLGVMATWNNFMITGQFHDLVSASVGLHISLEARLRGFSLHGYPNGDDRVAAFVLACKFANLRCYHCSCPGGSSHHCPKCCSPAGFAHRCPLPAVAQQATQAQTEEWRAEKAAWTSGAVPMYLRRLGPWMAHKGYAATAVAASLASGEPYLVRAAFNQHLIIEARTLHGLPFRPDF
jgi:hypothetical protein